MESMSSWCQGAFEPLAAGEHHFALWTLWSSCATKAARQEEPRAALGSLGRAFHHLSQQERLQRFP